MGTNGITWNFYLKSPVQRKPLISGEIWYQQNARGMSRHIIYMFLGSSLDRFYLCQVLWSWVTYNNLSRGAYLPPRAICDQPREDPSSVGLKLELTLESMFFKVFARVYRIIFENSCPPEWSCKKNANVKLK